MPNNRNIRALVLTFCGAASALACLSPANIEGVAFTDNETVEWSRIETLGTAGANFLKDGESPRVSYRYVSHYSPKAMAYVGNVGLSYQSEVSVNCMGVILDPDQIPGRADEFAEIDTGVFDFAEAVKVELEWLAGNDIIDLSPSAIERIFDSLSNAGNGGAQYWTCCASVLGYNSWYSYDTLSAVWGPAPGLDGPNAVRSPQGVLGGCSVIDMTFELPPQRMGGGAGTLVPRSEHATATMMVRNENGLVVELPQEWRRPGTLTIRKPNGQSVATVPVPQTARRLLVQGPAASFPAGWYNVEFTSGARYVGRASLVIR